MANQEQSQQNSSGLPGWLRIDKRDRAIAWARACAFWAELAGRKGAIAAVNSQIRKATGQQGDHEAAG
jgi:hypothetical protein